MLFKREQKNYLITLKTKLIAFLTVAFCIDDLFLFLNIVMTKSFQFGLDKIADAFQKRAEKLFDNSKN